MLSYRKGDYVDVIADGSVQKGMPFKFQHGERLALSSMSPSTPSESSSTSVSVDVLSPRDSMSALSTSACPDLALLSLIASTRTIRLSARTKLTPLANPLSRSRESPPNPE